MHYSATLFCSLPFSSLSSVLTQFPFPSTLLYATIYICCVILFYSSTLLFCSTVLCATLLYSNLLCSTVRYISLHFTLFYSARLYSTLLCSTLLYSAPPLFSTLLYFTPLYSTLLEGWIIVKDSFHNETGAARMMISCWHGSAK